MPLRPIFTITDDDKEEKEHLNKSNSIQTLIKDITCVELLTRLLWQNL